MEKFACARLWLALLMAVSLGLSGCQGVIMGKITAENSRPVPASRSYPGPQPAGNEAAGTLTLIRDWYVLADACLAQMHIDGVRRADLFTADRVTMRLAPGVHEVKMTVGGTLCIQIPGLGPSEMVQNVVVAPDRDSVFILRDMPLRLDPWH